MMSWLVAGSLFLFPNGVSEDHLNQVLLDMIGIHCNLTCNGYRSKFKYRQTPTRDGGKGEGLAR